MKTLFSIIFIFCFSNACLFADEIYLKDSKVIKGKILNVTEKNIEYSEEKGKPFLVIPRDKVAKIKYDNGEIVQIPEEKRIDKIFLKDGSIIEAGEVQITAEAIIYIPLGETAKQAIVRENVLKVVNANGKVIQITETVPVVGVDPLDATKLAPVKEEYKIRSGGFIDSTIMLGLVGAFSDVNGNIDKKEEREYKNRRSGLPLYTADGKDDEGPYIDHYGFHGGFVLDLMFPSIKYTQKRRFDLTGVKFGLKTTYLFSSVKQQIDDDSLPRRADYDGTLLRYRSINCGPEVNIVFSPRSDFYNLVVQLYVLGGYIHNGKLSAAPGLRDAGIVYNNSDYSANFTGYSVTAGLGLYYAINKTVPVTIGCGMYYSYSKIDFDKKVPVYDYSKRTDFYEIGITLSAGVHFFSI